MIVLDSHTLLWWVNDPTTLSKPAKKAVDAAVKSNSVHASCISSWEIALVGTMILALGMGFANAAIFKLVPKFTPKAVGGAAGIIGGLGAFGGFVIPPLMGLFVGKSGLPGYSQGFYVFLALCCLALIFFRMLTRSRAVSESGTQSFAKQSE